MKLIAKLPKKCNGLALYSILRYIRVLYKAYLYEQRVQEDDAAVVERYNINITSTLVQ